MLPNGFPSRQRGFIARSSRAALLLVILCLAAPLALGGAGEEGEALLSGPARERPIAAGETHIYRVAVTDTPLLVTVEQIGVNVVAEVQGPGSRVKVDARIVPWGSEVLLLESPGEHRIELRTQEPFVGPGRYTIQAETLSAAPDDRRAALSLMSRAGQEVVERNSETRHRAIASFLEALKAWRSLKDRRWEAETLDAIGALEAEDRQQQAVAEHYSQSLEIWQGLGETYQHRAAATLNELGMARAYMGQYESAREACGKAIALWQDLGGDYVEELTLTRSNLCYVEQMSGNLTKALTCYEEPLALYHELGDQYQEVRVLNNIGGVYFDLGEPEAALERFEQARAVRHTLKDYRGEAESLTNLGVLHRNLGEWQEAFRLYGQGREVLTLINDRKQDAALLQSIGVAYNNLGDPERAVHFLEDALKLSREINDRPREIATLNSRGSVWRKLGEPAKGLEDHRRAFELAQG